MTAVVYGKCHPGFNHPLFLCYDVGLRLASKQDYHYKSKVVIPRVSFARLHRIAPDFEPERVFARNSTPPPQTNGPSSLFEE